MRPIVQENRLSYPGQYPPYPPPQHYPPPGPPRYAPYPPRPPSRSAIPKVVGILAIVFSAIGLLISVAMTFGPADDLDVFGLTRADLGFFGTWMMIYLVLAIALFGLHLAAGISSVMYKPSAPTLMTAYAVAAMAFGLADLVISVAMFPEVTEVPDLVREELAAPRIGLEILALPWPVIALILMNLRGAKQACAAPGR